ncbi:3-oxoacyl-[acyl-carrier-protein] reductase [Hominifimenecus sp. rT4P-3]|uniref:3-oxoacyl-[acyl-carrier-protein] reductase n=1 Tax=Hominifimenecus sp. rT4P-3 TaxID=3242979 RepID=UPI003DA3ADCD
MLENRVAVVTGGAKGIGRAIALALAAEGALVIVNYRGSKDQAQETVRQIEAAGGKAEAVSCDVADGAAVEACFADLLARYGRIDILVNNAGITKDGLLMRMGEEEWDSVLNANLKGAFHCCKWAAKAMLKQRSGRIINISSVSGVMGNAGQANYSASKAGLIGLTKSVAREVASRGITVNAVAPGFVDTDMTAGLPARVREAASSQIPLGHFGRPEDIAAAVAFLASEKAGYITGQVLCVDGGMAM